MVSMHCSCGHTLEAPSHAALSKSWAGHLRDHKMSLGVA